uniref:Uncharacterized protein n=1 Tax=Chrysotila carterae TaxID=13221 RepID=A0A7S4C1V5_CHRCT
MGRSGRLMQAAAALACAASKQLPPRLLVCDFDSTITRHDSVSALLSHSPVCRSQRALVPRLVRLYLQDLEGVTAWLEAGDLEKALNLMGEVEHASLDRIEAANVLGGIQPATFKPPITIPHADNYQTNSDAEDPVGQVQLRAFATEALRAAAAVGVPVHVCSANWCKEWIRVGLGDAAAAVLSIDSNDIQMADGGNVSSGALVRKVVSPHDKLRSFQQLDESALAAQPGAAALASVYIGDALTDVLALQAADVGIVVGSSETLRRALAIAGKQVEPLSRAAGKNSGCVSPGIYTSSNWFEIAELLGFYNAKVQDGDGFGDNMKQHEHA